MTLWSGRVGGRLAPEVWEFLRAEDAELFPYDCRATALHARRLAAAGILTDAEAAEAEAQLAGYRVNMVTQEDEDVHSAIERLLGPLGAKIHAGRSRNDQVAAAFRLYVEDACAEAREAILALAGVVLDLAEAEAETPMPGYTHLQRAQPVTVGHHLLAWVEMLERDLVRFAFAAAQAAPSPLGAGALAGSTLPLPAPEGADQLRNSLDAVADRDFAIDYLYACTVLFTHLSRIGEELVLWSTSEFGFARLPEAAATGSSMMPQKLNPDVAELVRGKAGTAIGRLTGLLAVVKGLPLSYDRDLQEDKRPVFDARRDTALALAALGVLIAGLELDHDRLAAACNDPLLLATDAAEALVRRGRPVPRGPRAGRRAGSRGDVRAARGARCPPDPRAGRRARAGRRGTRAALLGRESLGVEAAERGRGLVQRLSPGIERRVLEPEDAVTRVSRHDVEVGMRNILSGDLPVEKEEVDPVAPEGRRPENGLDAPRNREHARSCLVVEVVQERDVILRDHDHVPLGRRGYVHESHHEVVVMDDAGRLASGDDLAEDAVSRRGHGSNIAPACRFVEAGGRPAAIGARRSCAARPGPS